VSVEAQSFCKVVNNLDAILAKLAALGDPDGNTIELWEAPWRMSRRYWPRINTNAHE